MHYFKNRLGFLAVIGTILFIYSMLPIGTAFEFSADEGFEVIKPFMRNKGYVLYKEIWDDQPPLFTVILSSAFRQFGPTILVARTVTAICGLVLVAAFHELIRRRSGQWCALLAAFFILASPGFLLLSVSVMQEVPAMSMGLLSAWLLFRWDKKRSWAWLLGSGAVMALAVQIKLTAILLIPAVLVELILLSRSTSSQSWKRDTIERLFLWSISMAAVSVLIGLTWGKGSLETAWKSHTAAQIVPGMDRVGDHRFNAKLLKIHGECVLGAALCVPMALWRKRGREIAFPMVLLLTDSLVHTMHKPWWDYYYLHLAVPLVWMTSWTVNEIIQIVFRLHAKYRLNYSSASSWKQVSLLAFVAFIIVNSERRLEGMVKDLRHHPIIESNPLVKKMKEYADRTKWAYSESGLYPFYAQLPVLPELAVVSLKRFWSGQITTREIVETCKQYKPELLILPITYVGDEWKDLLDTQYINVTSDSKKVMYVASRIRKENSP